MTRRGSAGPAGAPDASVESLVRAQQEGCRIGGSDLYVTILERVADDVGRGGPCHAVLHRYAHESFGEATVLRFLAAVHELVLSGRAEALAAHYPSAGGSPGPGVGDAFVDAVETHAEVVAERTGAALQTNEVGRSAALIGGLLRVAAVTGLPLRVLEVGASAGLNLRFDRYRYEAGGSSGTAARAFGPDDSPVRFLDPWVDRVPDLGVGLEVLERRGCDTRPLDPADASARLRLRACLWPDQPERRSRLDGALALAATVAAPVDRADAATWVAARLARPVTGAATVVMHSIVLQYLPVETRKAMKAAVVAAGRAATGDAPVAWISLEPATAREAEVRLTLWPGNGRTRSLALCGFHGPPVRWHG